ncbi:MAG: amino acid ABC transporter permease [Bacteriovorax sp.]|nr:amino acid ABC transporter permease [Bacteriovorax sp.]
MFNNLLQWKIFLQDTGGGETYLHWLMNAWKWTLMVSGLGWIVALVAGVIFGIMRTLHNKILIFIGNAWTELFKNIPLLVQIFIWYHVIPSIFPGLRQVSSLTLVVFGLGFFTSARISELVKAGIESLPKGQYQAGVALGLTPFQTYRYIVLPLAFRIILPPLTSEAMSIIKNSSVAFAVSISELTMFALQAGEETSKNIEMLFAVTVLYFLSAFAVGRLSLFVEKCMRLPGTGGGQK